MKKGVVVILSGAIFIHALFTLFCVGMLWGRSLTGVDPNGHGGIWEVFAFILSLPILRIAAMVDGDFVISYIYFMSFVNSIAAVAIVYYIYRWINKKRTGAGHKKIGASKIGAWL